MRTSTSNDYLTTGIAYAFRPHRDTWYTRTQPTAQQPLELEPSIVLLPPVGGIIAFSANQLHSSIPNRSGKTRLSIDFRTVHSGDAEALRGAVNLDAYCTGSAIDDYLRCSDLSHLPERVQRLYAAGHPQAPVLAPQRDAATP